MSSGAVRQRWYQTGGGEVLKSVAAGLLMLALAVFIYVAYRTYALRQHNEGDVVGEGQDTTPAHREVSPPADRKSAGGTPGGPGSPSAGSPATGSDAQVTATGAAVNPGTPAAPATDTIAPNPPNGLAFGAAGHYQVYRQGDITWRLNTETGATCVLFATDAEWRQPRIRRAACREVGR